MRFICPLCRLPLHQEPKAWSCPSRHSFDVARDGHVNLLPVQFKRSREPGDRKDMLRARRAFLEAGHYRLLRDALCEQLRSLAPATLLDLGCGEGYYTRGFRSCVPEVVGLDISKIAIQMAARQDRGATWLVASGAQLPLAEQSVDAVTCLFTPLHAAELHRVLRPAGKLLLVTPAPDHLQDLRAALFDEVRPHAPEKFLAALEGRFSLRQRQLLRIPLELDAAALQQLLHMTPYAWKARPARRAALEAQPRFNTEAAFALLELQRN